MLPWQQNFLHFSALLILFNKCYQVLLDYDQWCLNYMKFKYWINTSPTCDVTVFVKGAQNAQFSFRIFLKISMTLKAHISGMKTDVYEG